MGSAGRIAIGVAVLVAAVVLFVLLRPGDDEPTPAADATTAAAETTTGETTTETEAETGEATTGETTTEEEAEPLRVDVPASGPERIRRLNVRQGEEVELVVTLGFHDDVHVHGYDLLLHTGPGLPPAFFEFVADTPGRFEIEAELAGVQIAELRVRP